MIFQSYPSLRVMECERRSPTTPKGLNRVVEVFCWSLWFTRVFVFYSRPSSEVSIAVLGLKERYASNFYCNFLSPITTWGHMSSVCFSTGKENQLNSVKHLHLLHMIVPIELHPYQNYALHKLLHYTKLPICYKKWTSKIREEVSQDVCECSLTKKKTERVLDKLWRYGKPWVSFTNSE